MNQKIKRLQCAKCLQYKVRKYYAPSRWKAGNGYCRSCDRKCERAYIPEQRKHKHILKTYGVSLATYWKMLRAQGYRCGICRSKTPGWRHRYFTIDHCHRTGRVRGLLCVQCNAGIGQLRDNPRIIKAALKWLEQE